MVTLKRVFFQKYIFLKKFLLWDYYFLLADLFFHDFFTQISQITQFFSNTSLSFQA